MQHRPAYPHDVLTGGCFVSGDYQVTEDGIVDLDIYVDALPPFGRLCVSPKGVRMMAACLGWQIEDPAKDLELEAAYDRINELETTIDELTTALEGVVNAEGMIRAVSVVRRRQEAAKVEISEWIGSLERASR